MVILGVRERNKICAYDLEWMGQRLFQLRIFEFEIV